MMKIFICPSCGRMTAASRKREVFCTPCNEMPMQRAKLTFQKYVEMDETQRRDYSNSWLYIHNSGGKKS